MTASRAAPTEFANRPSQNARTLHTLRHRQLMEEAQRLEIGERIRELRERSPYTQQGIAERLGIGLRAYQKVEREGTTKWERCEELAEIYGVTPEWVWSGQNKLPTPDLMGSLNGSQLDRIENRLEEIYELLSPGAALADEAHEEQVERELAADVPDPQEPSEEAPPGRAAGGSRRATG